MNPTTSSSPEQIAANRENARRSTGPRTEEGKARAAQNARVHGLCSRQLHIDGDEEAALFSSIRASLTTELQPEGELEFIHFEAFLHAQWNLRRCRMNEANLLASQPDPFRHPDTRAALKTLSTYTARHERGSQRALTQLKALQDERAARTNLAGDLSPLVDAVRVRRALLAEVRLKAQINKMSLAAAIEQLDKGSPCSPISCYQFDLDPDAAAARRAADDII